MKNLLNYSLFILFFILTFQACTTKDPIIPDQDFSPSKDYGLASNLFGGVKDAADDAESGGGNIGGRLGTGFLGGCATIVLDTPATNDYRIIIDFGPTNCVGKDGRARRGKLFVNYNGLYRDSGTVISHTFENFFVNDHQLIGLKKVENMGPDQNGDPYFVITVIGKVIKPSGSDSISFISNRIRTWYDGDSTITTFPWWLDDKYRITGNGSGISTTGLPFTFIISKALIIEMPCPWIIEGTFELIPQGGSPRIVDYGDGTCDRKATLTFLGKTYQITI